MTDDEVTALLMKRRLAGEAPNCVFCHHFRLPVIPWCNKQEDHVPPDQCPDYKSGLPDEPRARAAALSSLNQLKKLL